MLKTNIELPYTLDCLQERTSTFSDYFANKVTIVRNFHDKT